MPDILGSCPAIWKCNSQLAFELYSPVFNFNSEAFLNHFCYPHPLRGEDKTVTILTITEVRSLDTIHDGTDFEVPTTDDIVELLRLQHINIADFAMLYPIYTHPKFSPSKCLYGNPDFPHNQHHRYVVVWKDGIQRLLPNTIRTSQAEYGLTASLEPHMNLPGFWSMEQAPTRNKYYNGMLKNLYVSHLAHQHQQPQIRDTTKLRGIPPSSRWYLYAANRPVQPTLATVKPAGQSPLHRGGRGHPSRPPLPPTSPRPQPSSYADSMGVYSPPTTEVTDSNALALILDRMDSQFKATQHMTAELHEVRSSQARINEELFSQLARIDSMLTSTKTPRK